MIENPQFIDQPGIMPCVLDNFRDLFYAGHVYVALLLEDDHPSFFPKFEFCLTIEESGGKCDRDDGAQKDQRHLLGKRQGWSALYMARNMKYDADSQRDGDNQIGKIAQSVVIGIVLFCNLPSRRTSASGSFVLPGLPQENRRRTAAERIEAGL